MRDDRHHEEDRERAANDRSTARAIDRRAPSVSIYTPSSILSCLLYETRERSERKVLPSSSFPFSCVQKSACEIETYREQKCKVGSARFSVSERKEPFFILEINR